VFKIRKILPQKIHANSFRFVTSLVTAKFSSLYITSYSWEQFP